VEEKPIVPTPPTDNKSKEGSKTKVDQMHTTYTAEKPPEDLK
jgi:hypothetical protein